MNIKVSFCQSEGTSAEISFSRLTKGNFKDLVYILCVFGSTPWDLRNHKDFEILKEPYKAVFRMGLTVFGAPRHGHFISVCSPTTFHR